MVVILYPPRKLRKQCPRRSTRRSFNFKSQFLAGNPHFGNREKPLLHKALPTALPRALPITLPIALTNGLRVALLIALSIALPTALTILLVKNWGFFVQIPSA